MNFKEILTPPKTIAVIGLSDKPARPSYQVAAYLQNQGFKIIPVNPAVDKVLGEKSYSSITAIPDDIKIDIVDIFRNSEAVPAIIEEIISLRIKPFIWMQEGVISPKGQSLAQQNDMSVVMNFCMKKVLQDYYNHSDKIGPFKLP
ncbi:MAG: CoA-binding protein [Candidatus Pacebacteria bacterium]|nr:CoA-binding protein [Candidatus Paceibacterota bacterium]